MRPRPKRFNTKLKGNEATSFEEHSKLFPSLVGDLGDYDTHGFYQEIYRANNGDFDKISKALTPGDPYQHLGSDRYKKPSHPTFSNESKYSSFLRPGGHWEDEYFVANRRNLRNLSNSEQGSALGYFQDAEDLNGDKIPDIGLKYKKNILIRPQEKQKLFNTFDKGGKMATPGTSFRELINYTTGKANASREDLESSLAAKGYKPSDIRKIGKAYERVSGSGNEYVLHPEKGFNVFDKSGKQQTGSGKKKGNKAGSDLGDLIGLGNDVSLLAGALRNELPGYTSSKQPKEIKAEQSATPSKEDTSTNTPLTTTVKTGSKPVKSTGKSPATGVKRKLEGFDPSKYNVKFDASSINLNGKKKNIMDYEAKGSGKPSKAEELNDEGFDWQKMILGDVPLLWDTENYKDLAALWNPAKLFSKDIADWSKSRLDARATKNKKEQPEGPNFAFPNTGLLTPFVKGMSGPKLLNPAQRLLGPARIAPEASAIEDNFLNNLTEDLTHVQKKGGKLMGKDGIKIPSPNNDEFDFSQYATAPDLGPEFFDSRTSPATQEEQTPGMGGNYGERTPGKGGDGRGINYGGILSGLVKYGIPAAYLGAEQNQIQHLRGLINPKLTAPELMTGAVRDLPRSDFSLPYQPGLEGSSLTEAQNSGLAREKFTRESKNNWELRNALNRQEQQNAVIDRMNQAAIQRTGISNQNKMINSANAFNEFAYLLGDRGVTAGSLFQNLDQGIYGAQVGHDARSLAHAQEVVRNPERYPNEQQWARKTLSGYTRKKGGKLSRSTKYSKMC